MCLVRQSALALSLILLAACARLPPAALPAPPAVPPAKVHVAPMPVPPTRIDRLIELTNIEWIRWGRAVVQVPQGDVMCLLHPDGYCDHIEDGCGQETTSELCPIVNEYWAAIPYRFINHSCRRTDVCEIQWPQTEPMPPQRTPPWSAAFVSAMMQRAGFSDREFLPAPSHAAYVVAARDGFMSAYSVAATPTRAEPGDLICVVRGQTDLTPASIALINEGSMTTPMHCEIVVNVDLAAQRLEAIGGNVQQTVAKSIIALDAEGRVTFDEHPDRPWILVMKARHQPDPAPNP